VEKAGTFDELTIEKIDFLIFAYSNFRDHLKKSYSAKGVTSDLVQIFFYTPLGHIKNSQRTEF
jgi:hypothetical protein